MGFRRWVKKKARKAKERAKDAGRAVKSGAKSAFKRSKKTVNDIVREVDDGGDRVKGLALRADRMVQEGIPDMDIERFIKDQLKDLKREVLDEVRDRADGIVKRGVSEAEDTFARKIPDLVTEKLPGVVEDKIPELIGRAIAELSEEAMKPVLRKAANAARDWHSSMDRLAKSKPELVGAIDSLGFSLNLKLNAEITLSYSGFYTRAQEVAGILDRYANDGIKPRRRDIIGFIEATGPTSVDLGIGAELSLGVDAGASFTLDSIPLKLFTELGDIALEKMGVPR